MKKNISKSFLALTLAMTMLLGSCGSTEDPAETPASSEATTTAYKSELNVAITANPPSLDVQGSNSNAVAGIGINIFEPLFAMNANYEPTPVLAEGYTVDESGLVYTITLRQGVKFHNGQEMTADDVVASMTRWLELSSKANTLIGGTTFEKVDDYTVKMTVNEPSSDIMYILASPSQFAAIYPKSVIDSATAEGVTEYIGTGPYKLEEFAPDQYVKLTRYDEYQSPEGEASGFAGEKTAPTETIYYRIVTDDLTRIVGLQTGEYDVAEAIPIENYTELVADETVDLSVKQTGTLNLFFNTTKGPLADPVMRQAVLAALNCDDIMLAAFGDPNLYVLNPGWQNPSDTQWASEAGAEYYNQNNQEKAKELLAQAGYNGETIRLVTTPDYSEMYKSSLVIQEQLKQVGINAEVESYDFATFMEHRSSTDQFDLFVTSNSYNMLPVQLTVMGESWAGLNAPEVKLGIEAIRFAATPEEASAAWDNLQTFLYEYGAASVLGHYSAIVGTSKNVEGFENFHYPVYWNAKVAE